MASFRQHEIQNPHFRLPLQFGSVNGGAFVNEQDTEEDVIDCVKAIISWPTGTRHDLPEFGVPDLVFQLDADAMIDQLQAAVEQWEDRADVSAEGTIHDLIADVLFKIGVVSNA